MRTARTRYRKGAGTPALAAALLLLAGCAGQPARLAADASTFGVLVMAHGGSDEWDQAVLDAVAPLRGDYPVEVAFGMADSLSLQDSVAKLEARGVRNVAVVRLFISGDSFLERTEQILGLRAGAPEKTAHADHAAAGGHSMQAWKLTASSAFAVSTEGLDTAPEMSDVLLDRAKALSRDARREDVLILAHGPGDDAENQRWLDNLDRQAQPLRDSLPFARVTVATLREDWPDKREAAEQLVREFVSTSLAQGRTPIVLPFRVHGFGPYAKVLDGLDYVADERGLLPHAAVTRWIDRQAQTLREQNFTSSSTRRAATE